MSEHPERQRALNRRVARGAVAHYEDAAYYDLAYKRRRDDVRFYVELAKRARGPVLELGAGTGRVALPIAESGRTIVAVEPVRAMRDRARQKLALLPEDTRARIRLRGGDARTLRLGSKFALVIMPFNVFMHLYTRSDVERALRTVRTHLAPRGRFAFDVSMPDLRMMVRSPGRLYRGPGVVHPISGASYDYLEAFEYDPLRQVQLVSMIFQNRATIDDLRTLPLSQRQFFPEELVSLLHYNGFAIVTRHGDFERAPLSEESESQVIVARAR
jgi:SAM-dependent methyltransferase